MLRLRLVVGNVVPSLGSGGGNTLTCTRGFKTRCAEKLPAEHYKYIHMPYSSHPISIRLAPGGMTYCKSKTGLAPVNLITLTNFAEVHAGQVD